VSKQAAMARFLQDYADYMRDVFHASWNADIAHTLEEQEDRENWLQEQRAKTAVPYRPWLKKEKERAEARKKIEEERRRKNGNLHDTANSACKACKRKRGLCRLHYWKYIGVRLLVKCLDGTTCLDIDCDYCAKEQAKRGAEANLPRP